MPKRKDVTSDNVDNDNKRQPIVSYWLNEITAARKREKDFRKNGERILEIYGGSKTDKTPFNILYSNTETLLPALYSAIPRPVVQRRFKDEDPLGKAAAHAGQRALEFLLDTNVEGYETFDDGMKAATLDALLPGRGITCVKYDTEIDEMPAEIVDGQPADPTPYKKSELVCVDTRSWNRVFFGYAKRWSKVPWIAYEEHLDKKEAIRLFGEKNANKIRYTVGEETEDDEGSKGDDEDKGERKTALVYQIWDKDGGKKIRYISPHYNEGFLKVDDDPLGLTGFFNCPRPMQFLDKSNDLLPTAVYDLYENQADELNEITRRIIRIVKAVKAKAVYDESLGDDIKNLLKADDLTLTPADKSSSLASEKGLQNAIWFWPVEKLILVLRELYTAREQCKQVIYEITGIADIMRGQTNASETLGAQEIKQSWGTLRLKRLQKEVQRYARDLLRIMLEIAATKFSEETWAKMTGLPFLTQEKFQQLTMIATAAKHIAQQNPNIAQQNPQAVQQVQQVMQELQQPQWTKVLEMLKDDTQRAYRIDIETNSTVEPEAVEDQKNISELMTAIGQFLNGIGPLVAKGVMPFEVATSMLLTICRRFRFGPEIEDQIKAMKAPPPQDDGKAAEAAKLQAQQQSEQQQMQLDQQKHQAEMQQSAQIEEAKHRREQDAVAAKAQTELAKIDAQHSLKAMELEAQKNARLSELQAERHTEQMKAEIAQETELKKAALQAATQIEIAEINAKATAAQATADNQAAGQQVAQTSDMMAKILERQDKLLAAIAAPKSVERDTNGRALRLVPQLNG